LVTHTIARFLKNRGKNLPIAGGSRGKRNVPLPKKGPDPPPPNPFPILKAPHGLKKKRSQTGGGSPFFEVP